MKVLKKEKQLKEVDVIIESYSLCDKCNEKIKIKENYDVFKCQFIHKEGFEYPEGGHGEEQEMELCQNCTVECVALLRANGYNVINTEWES